MRTSRRAARSDGEGGNPYWISFSDLMSGLLLIFILAVVILVLHLTEQQQTLAEQQEALTAEQETAQEQRELFTAQVGTLQEAELVRTDMLLEIQEELRDQGIEVIVSDNNTVLSIPTSLLGFDSASYDINPEFEDVSVAIGTAISDALTEGERYRYLDTVFVEGHTDNVEFDGLEGTGNWGLSTFRAISLWRLWDEELPAEKQLDAFVSAHGNPLFSVSGYGETRPVTDVQSSAADRAANRRIDVRFTVVHPSAEDLAEIVELPGGEES